jgi:hypothetical protein
MFSVEEKGFIFQNEPPFPLVGGEKAGEFEFRLENVTLTLWALHHTYLHQLGMTHLTPLSN